MNAIEVHNVSKKYILHHEKPVLLKDLLLRPFKGGKTTEEFWALKDINFEVKKGETVGIIGENGAGKSTLLKILTGVTKPTKGEIKVNARVGALLELGAGFQPDLTGRENIYLNGSILGLNKKDIDKRFGEIVDFSGIAEFIDAPVRTYSSGMFVRLGFSVAINMEPEVLLIDEALAVGDALFVQKCLRKIEEFQKRGGTIIFVSHDMNSIKKNCREVILLEHGEIIDKGEPKEVIDVYNAMIFAKVAAEVKGEKTPSRKEIASKRVKGKNQRYGTGEAEIIDVVLLDSNGIPTKNIVSGEQTCIRIKILFKEEFENVCVSITIRNRIGIDIYMINTLWKGVEIPPVKKDELITVDFNQSMSLGPDEYLINVGIAQSLPQGIKKLDWISDFFNFTVLNSSEFSGICNLNSSMTVRSVHDYSTAK